MSDMKCTIYCSLHTYTYMYMQTGKRDIIDPLLHEQTHPNAYSIIYNVSLSIIQFLYICNIFLYILLVSCSIEKMQEDLYVALKALTSNSHILGTSNIWILNLGFATVTFRKKCAEETQNGFCYSAEKRASSLDSSVSQKSPFRSSERKVTKRNVMHSRILHCKKRILK